MKNSHEFVDEYLKKPEFVELMRRLGALGDGNQDQSKSNSVLFSLHAMIFLLNILQLVILNSCSHANDGIFSIYLLEIASPKY